MAKTSIINVEINEKINSVYVTYETGTEKIYPANKLPKTVLSWIDSNQKSEPATEPEQPEEEVNAMVTHEPEIITEPDPVKASESKMEVMEMKKAEIITTAKASARSQRASEAVMLGVCLTLAVIWHILKESAVLLAIATATAACIIWNNRQEITASIRQASARIATATAEAYNANLPKLEAVKNTIIIHGYETIRAAIITVSILVFTARITAR